MLSSKDIERDLSKLRDIVIAHQAPGQPLETATATIQGVEQKVFASVESNLRELYQRGLQAADRDFLVYMDERFTFRESLAIAEDMAQVLLQRYGIEKGDRIAICSRNNPEWCMAYMAVTMIGAIVVPMNSWWQGTEMVYGLQDSGTRVLFADQQRIDNLQEYYDQL